MTRRAPSRRSAFETTAATAAVSFVAFRRAGFAAGLAAALAFVEALADAVALVAALAGALPEAAVLAGFFAAERPLVAIWVTSARRCVAEIWLVGVTPSRVNRD
jgi:chromate transport protein ChrA